MILLYGWFQVVSDGFRWFQMVSDSFWVVSAGFTWFQVVPRFSNYNKTRCLFSRTEITIMKTIIKHLELGSISIHISL